MIKIGDFSALFGISIKTVRFYEEEGLITPDYIDIYSGYRYYDENKIDSKIKDYEDKAQKLYKDINTLKFLSKNKEGSDVVMKTFINDERAIGKWELIGLVKEKEDYFKKDFLDLNSKENDDVSMKELFLMENGEEYWVISWSKEIIYICGRPNPYEIENDLMFVKLIDPIDSENYKVIVYKKIDNKKYTLEEIEQKDNIDVPFEEDKDLIGFWKAVDYVNNPNAFNPSKPWASRLYLEKMFVSPDASVVITMKDKGTRQTTYMWRNHFSQIHNQRNK